MTTKNAITSLLNLANKLASLPNLEDLKGLTGDLEEQGVYGRYFEDLRTVGTDIEGLIEDLEGRVNDMAIDLEEVNR